MPRTILCPGDTFIHTLTWKITGNQSVVVKDSDLERLELEYTKALKSLVVDPQGGYISLNEKDL